MGRSAVSRFAETHPQVYTREDRAEQEAKRRAVVYGLLGALISAMSALEFAARRGSTRIPMAGQWLGYLMRSRARRALVLLGWWWLGWHYFAR